MMVSLQFLLKAAFLKSIALFLTLKADTDIALLLSSRS
jgi:hypothetical protein